MANPIDEILGVRGGVASVLDLPAAVDPSVYETLVGDQHAPHSQTRFVETDLRCCKKHFFIFGPIALKRIERGLHIHESILFQAIGPKVNKCLFSVFCNTSDFL